MVRKSNKKVFIVALGITLMVFVGGLYAGWLISKQKISTLRSTFEESERNFEKFQVSLLLQDVLPEKSCEALRYRNKKIIPEISKLAERLSQYDRTKKFDHPEEFESLREDYTLLYIRYWLQMRKVKEDCGSNITTILYFFSDENCPECESQGKVLDYWKNRYKNSLLVFPLTTDLGMDSVEMIKKSYDVNETPAIVINGNKTYEGFQSKQDLREILK